MSPARLRARITKAIPVGAARLANWALVFDKPSRDGSAKANIRQQVGGEVWGVIWELREEDWEVLDRFEPGYERLICRVRLDAARDSMEAWTYVYSGPPDHHAAFDWYLDHLIEGARAHALPEHWQTHLIEWRSGCLSGEEAE